MERIDYRETGRDAFKLLGALSAYSRNSSVDYRLVELVKRPPSQVTGCPHSGNPHLPPAGAGQYHAQAAIHRAQWRFAVSHREPLPRVDR